MKGQPTERDMTTNRLPRSVLGFLKGAGTLLVGFALWAIVSGMFRSGSEYVSRQTMTAARMERLLEREPSLASLSQAFKVYYPEDYDEILNEISETYRSTMSDDEAGERVFYLMRDWVVQKKSAILQAPDRELARLADIQARLVASLRTENVRTCADFGMSGIRPNTDLSEPTVLILSESAAQMLRAAYMGETAPVNRDLNTVADHHWGTFLEEIRSNGTSERIVSMLGSSDLTTASTNDQCEVSVALYQALADLPDDDSALLMAVSLSEMPSTEN